MEDYTTWTAGDLIQRLIRRRSILESNSFSTGMNEVSCGITRIQSELDRRCDKVFEWIDDQLHIKAKNSFVGVHQTMWTDVVGCHWSDIDSFPIENPADFSALLQYFISKPKL